MATVLIQGGRVLDGTGAAAFEGDVLLEDDRIAGLLTRGEEAPAVDRVLDASGCVVSPGFIDMHSHAEWCRPDSSTCTPTRTGPLRSPTTMR